MSEVVWLTLAAMALFLVLLVPANYLLSLLMASRADSSIRSSPSIATVTSSTSATTAILIIPTQSITVLPNKGSTTKTRGFDQLAAAQMVPFGIAIFCDDIREETGGKISLMGVYGTDMQFLGLSFPIIIPRLGIHIVARLPIDRPVPPIKFLIYFPDDAEDAPAVSNDFPVPDELRRERVQLPPPLIPDAGEPTHILRQHIIVSPAIIPREGFIRARMMYGEERIRLGILKVHSGGALPVTPASP